MSVWNAVTRELIAQFNGPRADCALLTEAAVLAFSPNDQLLAAGSTKSSSLVVFDFAAQRSRWRLPERISIAVNDCAFSPDGQQIATAHADGNVRVWRLGAQDDLSKPMVIAFQSGMQMAVAFSPDGKRLATVGGDDPLVKLWDMDTRQEVARLPELLDYYPKVAFLPDGNTLVGASQRELRVWRAIHSQNLPIGRRRNEDESQGGVHVDRTVWWSSPLSRSWRACSCPRSVTPAQGPSGSLPFESSADRVWAGVVYRTKTGNSSLLPDAIGRS